MDMSRWFVICPKNNSAQLEGITLLGSSASNGDAKEFTVASYIW